MTSPGKALLAKLALLDDELERRVIALFTACPYDLDAASVWRSEHKQAQLYAAYLAGTGNLAAKPGRSKHEKTKAGKPASQALDIRYPGRKSSPLYLKAVAWVHEHADDYGIHFPVRGENWHAEATKHAPRVVLDVPILPTRPATNVPDGTSPLLGLQNPRLYGPKVADVQRVLIKVDPANRARLGTEVDLKAYGPKTAALVKLYATNRGLAGERGVTEPVWAALRKDARR